MEQKKEIKVYGTLMNHTIDPAIEGKDELGNYHYDAIAHAYQLYDKYFRENDNTMAPVQRFQDVINRRLTAISYADGVTTIEGDLVVEGDVTFKGEINGICLNDLDDVDADNPANGSILIYDNGVWKPSNITILDIVKSMLWEIADSGKIQTVNNDNNVQYEAIARGFYDSSVN